MKQKILILFILLTTLLQCKKSSDDSFLESLSLLFLRKDRVTISGSAVKGIIKRAEVNIHKVNSDGTCDTNSSLGSASTDENGNYSVLYNKTNGIVCIRVKASADGFTKMYDEKTRTDISISPNSDFNLTNIFSEDKLVGSARGNNSVSPFSRMVSRRFANLIASSGGRQTPRELNQLASREVVIRFGLSSGLASSNTRNNELLKNTRSTSVNANDFPELLDLNLDFSNLRNPLITKQIAILAGFSQLANQNRTGSTVTSSDVDSVIESFAKDFEDGIFDGKDGKGATVFIGTGARQIPLPANSVTNLLTPAITTYFAEGGTLSVGQSSTTSPPTSVIPIVSVSTINQIQFLDSVQILTPVIQTTTPTPTPTPTFTIGGTVTGLTTSGLVLQNNVANNISISSGSSNFVFPTAINSGSSYSVSILTQPGGNILCQITNGTGTATGNVTNIAVVCAIPMIGGTIQKPLNLTGVTTIFAGGIVGVTTGGTVDGSGSTVRFNIPHAIATDGINMYISQNTASGVIRKIVIATGVVSTFAGPFASPAGITMDDTNLYITEYSPPCAIRKIDIATATPTLVAGGSQGFSDATGASAQFSQPEGITVNGPNLYVADGANQRIRKIVIATGAVTTFAGNGTGSSVDNAVGTSATFSAPSAVVNDGINLYVSERNGNKIRRITIGGSQTVTTIAGTGGGGTNDGPGASATFSGIYGMTTDGSNLYIADTSNQRIRKIVLATNVVSTLAGSISGDIEDTGSAARFANPRGPVSDGVSLFIAEIGNNKIKRIQ